MKRVEFEQILDNTRKVLEVTSKIEQLLNVEIDSICGPLCNITDVLADITKAMWNDELWSKVYDYNVPTFELMKDIENYSVENRKSRGEEEVKLFDEE